MDERETELEAERIVAHEHELRTIVQVKEVAKKLLNVWDVMPGIILVPNEPRWIPSSTCRTILLEDRIGSEFFREELVSGGILGTFARCLGRQEEARARHVSRRQGLVRETFGAKSYLVLGIRRVPEGKVVQLRLKQWGNDDVSIARFEMLLVNSYGELCTWHFDHLLKGWDGKSLHADLEKLLEEGEEAYYAGEPGSLTVAGENREIKVPDLGYEFRRERHFINKADIEYPMAQGWRHDLLLRGMAQGMAAAVRVREKKMDRLRATRARS